MATLRKVDKPRTAMASLKREEKSIKNRDLWLNKPYANTRIYNKDKDLKANREKQASVQKVIDSRTKANNKDLSKSLWSVANNRWMKNADVKWTVKLAEKTLSAAKQRLRTHDASMWWTKQQHDALKKQVKTAERNLKSLNKTASRRK